LDRTPLNRKVSIFANPFLNDGCDCILATAYRSEDNEKKVKLKGSDDTETPI